MRELAAAYAAGEAYGAEAAIEMLSKSRLQVLNSDPEVEYFMPSPSGPVQVQFTIAIQFRVIQAYVIASISFTAICNLMQSSFLIDACRCAFCYFLTA